MKLYLLDALCAQYSVCDMVSLTWRSLVSSFAAAGAASLAQSTASPPNFVPAVHSFQAFGNSVFHLPSKLHIIVDSVHASSTEDDGLTLIPPSLLDFAQTFASDVKELFPNTSPLVSLGSQASITQLSDYVFLTLVSDTNHTLANGSPTTEGYEMQVTSQAVKIAGSGAKGIFWGTRTLLQGLVLSNQQFPASTILDQPDWKTRGAMLGKAQFLTRGFIYGLTHRT
jgi:hexosaminidase